MYYTINIIFFMASICLILGGLLSKKENNFLNKLYKKLKPFVENHYKIVVTILFIITIFTSVFKLGEVPYGLHVDEAGMAYDAISLASYQIDRYQKHFPVYLINYGGGQSAMYAYLTVILIKLFGYSVKIIRTPAVLLRLLTFVSILFIMKNEKNKLKSTVFLFIFSICPYFIMQSRWGLDCNLLVRIFEYSCCIIYSGNAEKIKYIIHV